LTSQFSNQDVPTLVLAAGNVQLCCWRNGLETCRGGHFPNWNKSGVLECRNLPIEMLRSDLSMNITVISCSQRIAHWGLVTGVVV
jgi:hypothetical protein